MAGLTQIGPRETGAVRTSEGFDDCVGKGARSAVDDWLRENGSAFRYERLSANRDSHDWIVVVAVEGDTDAA